MMVQYTGVVGGTLPAPVEVNVTMNVIDNEGNYLTKGLRPLSVCDEALMVAQRIADRRGQTVWLVPSDLPEEVDPWSDDDERVIVVEPEFDEDDDE